MAESEEELRSLLMKIKVESGKVGLKLNFQKTKIMPSGPITSRQIGKKGKQPASFEFMATVTICSDFQTQENKVCHCFHCFPMYFPYVMGPDAMILVSEC